MIIIDDASEDNTDKWLESLVDDKLTVIIDKERKGHTYWYDEGMRRAKTDIVSILHSDMIIGPGYFENMLKHLDKGKVVCATRIEPPIHPAGLEKHTQNFGIDYHDFDWKAFEIFCHPDLSVAVDDVSKARTLAHRLQNDSDFYDSCSTKAKKLYREHYDLDKWKKRMHNILS